MKLSNTREIFYCSENSTFREYLFKIRRELMDVGGGLVHYIMKNYWTTCWAVASCLRWLTLALVKGKRGMFYRNLLSVSQLFIYLLVRRSEFQILPDNIAGNLK